MREHQIVITLKPEQFQEVQRLARAAGNKSMGVFVRQKLLVALGLERAEKEEELEGQADPDWKHIAGELRRLHRELQVFISESLSADDYNQMLVEADEQENVLTGSMLLEGLPIEGDQDFDEDEMMMEESASTTVLDETGKEHLAHDVRDEMEELAERAFAISPRLGPIEMAEDEKPLRTFSDPLGDLLETTLLTAAQENASAALNELLDEQLAEQQGEVEDGPTAARISPDMVTDEVGDPALTWDRGRVDFAEEDERADSSGHSDASTSSDEQGHESKPDDEDSSSKKQDDKPPPFTGPPPKKRR